MFAGFNWQQMISAFIVLFAVIDIIGSIPIIINLKEKGKDVNAMKATVISFALLIGFFYAGDMMLKLFHVDIESFAVAGAFVIFLMSLEMILDIEIFKNQGPIKEATLVPLVFPLLAGAGAFTTLLSLRAEYASVKDVYKRQHTSFLYYRQYLRILPGFLFISFHISFKRSVVRIPCHIK